MSKVKEYKVAAGPADHPSLILMAIEELEQRAHRLGLTIGARALNNAKNALGWEVAGNFAAADQASRGERAA